MLLVHNRLSVEHNCYEPGAEDMPRDMTVTIAPDADMLVSHCVDLDIASQGSTDEEAIANLERQYLSFLRWHPQRKYRLGLIDAVT